MDDVAGMFQIADVQHDLHGAPAVALFEFHLHQLDDIGVDGALIGVQLLVEQPQLLEPLDRAALQHLHRQLQHAVEQLRHAPGFGSGRWTAPPPACSARCGRDSAARQANRRWRPRWQHPLDAAHDGAGKRQEDDGEQNIEADVKAHRRHHRIGDPALRPPRRWGRAPAPASAPAPRGRRGLPPAAAGRCAAGRPWRSGREGRRRG
jgi:hypothetical protein